MGPRRSPRVVAVDEVRPEAGLPPAGRHAFSSSASRHGAWSGPDTCGRWADQWRAQPPDV